MYALVTWIRTLSLGEMLFLAWASVVFCFWTYQTSISLAGWKGARHYPAARTKRHFAVLVAAHNEEAVIGQLIDSLSQQTYPADRFDTYVSCDNCTDRTAEVVRSRGAVALIREDAVRCGKTWNVRWALGQIPLDQYYGVVLLDADNVVHPEFLDRINDQCEASGDVDAVQGYVDTKNPDDSWVTRCYAIAYWHGNRFWQLARHNRGMSALLVGTGLMITTRCLQQIGWNLQSLTEDLEFSAQLILNDRRVLWNEWALVYDEKPVGGRSSYRQRSRWMQGHYWVFWNYGWKALGRFLRTGRWQYFDLFLYLLFPGKAAVNYSTFVSLSAVLWLYDRTAMPAWLQSSPGKLAWVALAVAQCLYMAVVSPSLRYRRLTFRYFLAGFSYFWYGLTWFPILARSFVTARDQSRWVKTEHSRSLSISQMSEEGIGD